MVFSRVGVSLMALLTLAGIIQQWVGPDALPVWRLFGVLLLVGFFIEAYASRAQALRLRFNGRTSLRLGRRESLSFCFESSCNRPLAVEFALELPVSVRTAEEAHQVVVPANGHRSITIPAMASEPAGTRRLAASTRVRGRLGLAWWHRQIDGGVDLQVEPDFAATRSTARGDVRSGQLTNLSGSGSELHHLRPYVAGDPMPSVDWKATARSSSLVTRVMSQEQHLEIMVVLDIGRTALAHADGASQFAHYLNLVASLAKQATSNGDQVGFIAAAAKPMRAVKPQTGSRALRAMRDTLRELQPMPQETDLVAAVRRVQQLLSKRSLVVILTDFFGQTDKDSLARSVALLRRRHRVITVGLCGQEVRDLAEGPAPTRQAVYRSLAAQEFRSSLQHNAQALEKLGASTLLARPENLIASVLGEYQRLRELRLI